MVGGRRALLFRALPVPVAVGLVHGAEVVEVYAVVLFDAFQRRGHEACKVVVAVVAQVERTATAGVGGQSVLGVVDWRRVEESQEVRHAALLGHAQELALAGLAAPVVGGALRVVRARRCALHLQETLRAGTSVDLRFAALLTAAGTEVEAPKRQPDAARLPRGVGLHREEPVGNLRLLAFIGPCAY